MPTAPSRLLDAAAWADLFQAAPPDLRRTLDLRAVRIGGALVLRSRVLGTPMFNRAIDVPADRRTVDAIVRAYADAGIDRYLVQGTAALERHALACGLSRWHRDWVVLERGPGPVVEATTDFTIAPAESHEATAFARILAAGLDLPDASIPLLSCMVGRPGWSTFVARDGAGPVAAAALYVEGNQAYLAGAATLPGHRGRGAHGALLAARIRAALARSCDRIVSETGEAVEGERNTSELNMRRAGLRPTAKRVNYAPSGTAWGQRPSGSYVQNVPVRTAQPR